MIQLSSIPATSRPRTARQHAAHCRRRFTAPAALALALSACGDTAGDDPSGAGTPVAPAATSVAPGNSSLPTTPASSGTPSAPGTDPNPAPMPAVPGQEPQSVAPSATNNSPLPDATPTTPAEGSVPVPTPTAPTDPMMPGPADPQIPDSTPAPEGNGSCTFDVDYELSSAIGTVGIVTWSADIAVEEASIEFGLAGQPPHLSAPVDLNETDYRTLLLGMKGATDYEFEIIANGGGQTCTSETFSISTDPVPNSLPQLDVTQNGEGASQGFFVTSVGLGNLGGGGFGGGGGGGGGSQMFIFDADGDIVWWADAPPNATRARMDWEGKNMYVTALNYPRSGGQMRRVSMDGLDVDGNIMGLSDNHHDFTVAPGGIVTTILWTADCNSIVERSPDGSLKTVVASTASLYQPGSGMGGGAECHTNAITYQPDTDTYIVSDRFPNLFVKFDRQGNLIWQFGGNNPLGMHITGGSWNVNHGHHLLSDGTFVFFNNENGNPSPVRAYALDENGGSASMLWQYSGSVGSATLGDAQLLPNGNTIITYSNTGTIVEIDSNQNLVKTISTDSLGYTIFRESLYGPPPK